MNKLSTFRPLALMLGVLLTGSAMARTQATAHDTSQQMRVSSGTKMKVKGIVLKRDTDSSFIIRDQAGAELTVRLAGNTKIEEKKSNPFRGSKKYATTQLVRGLSLEVEGTGDNSGALLADKIKFSEDDLKVGRIVDSQVVPMDRRLGETEDRLTRTEKNAERLS